MVASVNVGRINDVVDVWAYSIRLKDPYIINIIKDDIIKRCQIYKKTIPFVSVSQDPCQAYIIKPVNGKYELEDFFLNRLMLGVRRIFIDGSFEDMNADYNTLDKDISINIARMKKSFDDESTRHPGLVGKRDKIILKTIEHEIGHCFTYNEDRNLQRDSIESMLVFMYEQEAITEKEMNFAYFSIECERLATMWGVEYFKNNSKKCLELAAALGLC